MNPLTEMSPYIDFVETGESLYSILENYPDAEIYFDDENEFTVYRKNQETGFLEEINTCCSLTLYIDDIANLCAEPATLDFSIYDDKLAQTLQKVNQINR